MKRFGVVLASTALGAAVAASGPALAFGGGHGGSFGGGHMGGGFGGGHMAGGFTGNHMMGMGGFNSGFGFHRGFVGRSMATRGFNRGFDHRIARFDHFRHFHPFRNRFAFFPFFVGGVWDYGYPYADCGYWGNLYNPYCRYDYPGYASSYPDFGYDNGYAYYGYPSTGPSGYYAAAPLATGRSEATGQLGSYCTISVKDCELHHASGSCSCQVPGGRGLVTH